MQQNPLLWRKRLQCLLNCRLIVPEEYGDVVRNIGIPLWQCIEPIDMCLSKRIQTRARRQTAELDVAASSAHVPEARKVRHIPAVAKVNPTGPTLETPTVSTEVGQ